MAQLQSSMPEQTESQPDDAQSQSLAQSQPNSESAQTPSQTQPPAQLPTISHQSPTQSSPTQHQSHTTALTHGIQPVKTESSSLVTSTTSASSPFNRAPKPTNNASLHGIREEEAAEGDDAISELSIMSEASFTVELSDDGKLTSYSGNSKPMVINRGADHPQVKNADSATEINTHELRPENDQNTEKGSSSHNKQSGKNTELPEIEQSEVGSLEMQGGATVNHSLKLHLNRMWRDGRNIGANRLSIAK